MILMLSIDTGGDLDKDQVYWMNILNQDSNGVDIATALGLIEISSAKFLSARECLKPIVAEIPRKPLQPVCSNCGHHFVAREGDLCDECRTYLKIDSRVVKPVDQAALGRFC